jgi:hypothetical protein
VPDIDGRAVFLQRALDDLDGANDTGTKTSGLGENYLHVWLIGKAGKAGSRPSAAPKSSPETFASTRFLSFSAS